MASDGGTENFGAPSAGRSRRRWPVSPARLARQPGARLRHCSARAPGRHPPSLCGLRIAGAAASIGRAGNGVAWPRKTSRGLLARCGLGDRAAFGRLYGRYGRETLRRGAPYSRQPQRRRGSRAGSIRQDLAQRRPVPGRARQCAGLDGVDRAQPGDRPLAGAAGADARHRRHGRSRRSRADAGGEALRSDDRRRIEACLGALPRDRAQAVQAAYVEGWSYDELARHFEVPLNTMRTWLRRALISLRECLGP